MGTKVATKSLNSIARAYIQAQLESNRLVYGTDFQFESKDKFVDYAKKISIFVPSQNFARNETFDRIKTVLVELNVNVKSYERRFHFYIDYNEIVVPEDFIKKLQADGINAKANKKVNADAIDSKDEFAPVLKIVKDYEFLAFEKSRTKDEIIFIIPDSIESIAFKHILDSFQFSYKCDSVGNFKEVTVVFNSDIKTEDILVIDGFKSTDRFRFSEELTQSILITLWEIARTKMPAVQLADPLSADATRSTRFSMPQTKANEAWIDNFCRTMMINYRVDIEQPPADQNTFFVLSHKDEEYAKDEDEQDERESKKRSRIHPVSKLLVSNGLICYKASLPKKTVCFTLRLYWGSQKPRKLILVHGNPAERAETFNYILGILLDAGHDVAIGGNGGRIDFLGEKLKTRKTSHPLNEKLFKNGFLTRTAENMRDKEVVFQIILADDKRAESIIFSGGDKKTRKYVSSKMFTILEKLHCQPIRSGDNISIKIGNDPYFGVKKAEKPLVTTPKPNDPKPPTSSSAVIPLSNALNPDKPTISEIAKLLGYPSWSNKKKEEGLCYSKGGLDKDGWFDFNILGKGTIEEKAAAKFEVIAKAKELGYTDECFKNMKPNTGSFYFKDVAFVKPSAVEPGLNVLGNAKSKTSSKTIVEDESFKSLGNQVISLFVKELTENPGLHKRISILFPQEKVDPAETKRLVSGILEKEFTVTPASFEGPAGKFYSDDEIKKFIDRVINDLPS